MVTFIIIIIIFFIVLNIFVKLRHVALIYLIGNIILFIYFASLGQDGGWAVLIYQIPAIGPAFIGTCIGQGIGHFRLDKNEAVPLSIEKDG